MGDNTIDAVITDRWADQTARTLRWVRIASTTLLIGAGLAVVLGLVVAFASLETFDSPGTVMDRLDTFQAGQFANAVLSSLLPAGLMLAAGGYLRLQVARFETELLMDDLEEELEVESA